MNKRLLIERTRDEADHWGDIRWAVAVWRWAPVWNGWRGWHEVRVAYSATYDPPAEILEELRRH